jgi:caspase domain-containing protein
MTRKALLIACPGNQGERDYLPGTLVDTENYHDFLYSYHGGDWYGSEINKLVNPSSQLVTQSIQSISSDYSLVVFSGHGGVGKSDNRMYAELKNGGFDVHGFKTNAKRQTLILDTCRTIFEQPEKKSLIKALMESDFGHVSNARQIFDAHLEACEEGLIVVYSSKVGQASGETSISGGFFSSSLLKAGKNWGKSTGTSPVLDFQNAFESAVKIMNATYLTLQDPEIEGGRRKNYFPFAIRNAYFTG